MAIQRLFVRKRDAFANEAAHVLATLQQELHVPATAVQIYERYDVENLSDDALQKAKHLIFSEPPVDLVAETLDIPENAFVFAIEYVPGQYDQRADSAEQCISMLTTYNRSYCSLCPSIHHRRYFHGRRKSCHQTILH